MRMGGRLTVRVELREAFHDMVFPPLVLQTLVGNALKHGVEPKVGPVHITVAATLHEDTLEVPVADSGVGLGRGDVSTIGSGMGLANIRDRLQGIYDGRAELRIAERAEGGVLATVCLSQPSRAPGNESKSPALDEISDTLGDDCPVAATEAEFG